MMMKRLLAAAMIVGAPALSAQTHFQFNGPAVTAGNYNSMTGQFIAGTPLIGHPVNGFTLNTAFQVWCVDQQHAVNPAPAPAFYNVVVTRMDGALTAGVNARNSNNDTYAKAAWVANNMGTNGVNDSQYAIWAIMHGKAAGTECSGWNGSIFTGSIPGCTGGAATIANNAGLIANYGSVNKAEWFIIHGQNDLSLDHGNDGNMQELIARCVAPAGLEVPQQGPTDNPCDGWNPPNEDPTPEPATMSLLAMGLAGMAGNTLRRRKQK